MKKSAQIRISMQGDAACPGLGSLVRKKGKWPV